MDIRKKTKENEKNQNYRRTSEARHAIDLSFQNLIHSQEKRKCGYVFTGNPSYGFVLHGFRVDSENILDVKTGQMNSDSQPVVVLDIGAGDFSFNRFNDMEYKGGVITYGIAANDIFRNSSNQVNDEFHVFGNAEYVCSKEFEPDKFDYIFSARTFMHFVDPVGSVIEAYNALKPGGVLLIDQFNIPGCENITAHLVAYLQSQGYSITAGSCFTNISQFIIKKTSDKPVLEFPLIFHGINNNHVQYYPNEKLIQFCQRNNLTENAFQYGKANIIQEVINEIGEDILRQCSNIPELLVNQDFNHLSPQLQYKCLLAVVAMTTDIKSYNDIVNRSVKLDSEHNENAFSVLYKQNIKMSEHSVLHMLANDVHFKMYQNNDDFSALESVHQQLRIITLTAIEDIIRLAHASQAQDQLKLMGVPFKEVNFHQFAIKNPFDFEHIIKNSNIYFIAQCLGDGRAGDTSKRVENNKFENISKILDNIPLVENKLQFLQFVFELINKNENQLYTHTDSYTPGYTKTQVLHITALKELYLKVAQEHTSKFVALLDQDKENQMSYNPRNKNCVINKNTKVVPNIFDRQTKTNEIVLKLIDKHNEKSLKHK